jgi:hypothetical protein
MSRVSVPARGSGRHNRLGPEVRAKRLGYGEATAAPRSVASRCAAQSGPRRQGLALLQRGRFPKAFDTCFSYLNYELAETNSKFELVFTCIQNMNCIFQLILSVASSQLKSRTGFGKSIFWIRV